MARAWVLLVLLAGCFSPQAAHEPAAPATASPAPPPVAHDAVDPLQLHGLAPGIHPITLPVGNDTTTARIAVPAGTPQAVVIMAKGLLGGPDQMDPWLEAVMAGGDLGLAIEYRGEPDTWRVAAGAQDVAAAAVLLRAAFPDARIVAFGFSMGAQITALAALQAAPATFDHLVLAGAVTDLAALWHTNLEWRPLLEQETGGRPEQVPGAYLARSPLHHAPSLAAADMERVHLVHGMGDTLVPASHSQALYHALAGADVGVSLHEVAGNRDAWVCAPGAGLCVGALPVGPANHEASVIGPVGPLLDEVVRGQWDGAAGPQRYVVDGVTGARVPVRG